MPRLTPTEKQDIIRFLEADKPLPDKYRFLLFDDKREVELVWNSKTAEVCNLVLPFQVIEQVDEPRAETVKEEPTLFNMDARGRQLRGWTNKLIWGDNKPNHPPPAQRLASSPCHWCFQGSGPSLSTTR